MKKVLILHGPNLNLLGEREPEIYGKHTLSQINRMIRLFARKKRLALRIYQSNEEGALISLIHENRHWAEGMVINPAAYSHYSYAIRDAVAAMKFPTVEVHLSDIHKREPFRKRSVIAPVCVKQISGFGWRSYVKGIECLLRYHCDMTGTGPVFGGASGW